mmetsp:Transcript_27643/g.77280  ORF Transcript_27643/g.77280 Transcript_27643/m.77280 type:complete len:435 (+) Transcript_27643:86-1390(+)
MDAMRVQKLLRESLKVMVYASGLRAALETFYCVLEWRKRMKGALSNKEDEKKYKKRETAASLGELLQNTLRFGLFVASFSALFKLLKRVLLRAGFRGHKLIPAVAGFIAGISILIERQDWMRVYLAQYFLVRALEALYHNNKAQGGFIGLLGSTPVSVQALFCLISAQAMYAYVMRPTSIPASYYRFIRNAGPVEEWSLRALERFERKGEYDYDNIHERYYTRHEMNPAKPELFPRKGAKILPCTISHPRTQSCMLAGVDAFTNCFHNSLPIYTFAVMLPLIVRKGPRNVLTSPTELTGAVRNICRHATFLSLFCGIYQSTFCAYRALLRNGVFQQPSRLVFWAAGLFAGLSSQVESESSMAMFNLFALPKVGESIYVILSDYFQPYIQKVNKGEIAMFMAACSILSYFYQVKPQLMNENTLNIFHFLLNERAQ